MLNNTLVRSLVSNLVSGKCYSNCRLCFCQLTEGVAYRRLDDDLPFKNSTFSKHLAEIVAEIGLKVSEPVTGLEAICNDCMKKVVTCHNFVAHCNKNQKTLASILENVQFSLESIKEKQVETSQLIIIEPNVDETVIIKKKKVFNENIWCVCPSCEERFKKQDYMKHCIEQHKKYLCTKCTGTFKTPYNFRRHMNHAHKISFPLLKPKPTDNIITNLNENIWCVCPLCEERFTKSDYMKHCIEQHKKYLCTICTGTFKTPFNFRRHMNHAHKISFPLSKPKSTDYILTNLKDFICKHCGKRFHSYTGLLRHEKNHDSDGYNCTKCKKKFKIKETFETHKELCEKGLLSPPCKEFVCEHCSKCFSNLRNLNFHRKQHHGSPKFSCEFCGKKFIYNSRLREHIVKHTKDKKFQCTICGNKFVTSRSLLYHTRRHTGEKPYACEHCEKTFVNKSRRLEHVLWKHSQKLRYPCTFCKRQFNRPKEFNAHLQLHSDPTSSLYVKTEDNEDN